MKRILSYIILFFQFVSFGCSNSGAITNEYYNPVLSISTPDPTIMKTLDGAFYLYGTEDIRNVPIYKSLNLIDWQFIGTAFTDESRPKLEPEGSISAPEINYINGRYVLYYSMSVLGEEWTCGIGVAVSDNPEGPFMDKGKLFRSDEIGIKNSIDPFYIEDEGKKYLFWGSFRGIYATELTDDGLSLKPDAKIWQIAGSLFEGTYIHKRDDYYYMFASVGSCCKGIESTYQLVVGRSKSLFGPYTNRDDKRMLDGNYTRVIGSNERFVGNGHCSQIVQDKSNNDWIFLHGVDVDNPQCRVLLLNQVKWDAKGWPYVEGGSPSLNASSPRFS